MKFIFPTILLAFSLNISAQENKLTKADMQNTIDSLSANLNRIYVFPEIAKSMSDHITKNWNEGKYSDLNDPHLFADALTQDMQHISHDLHLNMRFAPQMVADLQQRNMEEEPDMEAIKNEMGKNNFGFEEVKILPGNIGYIKLNGFTDAAFGGDAAAAAMNFVSYADVIIFDLRDNGGGSPSMIQLLSSYLFAENDMQHLNNFYYRPGDDTVQTWTLPYVPGKRNPDALVYILTSSYTFSAAEEFTYNLKNMHRGTVVGEVTGGGAHPGGQIQIGELFVCFIPNGRAINPITNTNWEGTGVSPDHITTRDNALITAQKLALDSLSSMTDDERSKDIYRWSVEFLNSKLNTYKPDPAGMKTHAGIYGPRTISFENDALFYQRTGRPKFRMQPISPTKYLIADLDLIIEMEMEGKKVVAILVSASDGMKDRNLKQ